MAITILDSDKTVKVPYGFKGEKITISEMIKTPEFTSLEPLFAERILDMIRDNPSIGILKGGGGRSEEQVRNLFYANYKKINDAPDYENDASKYEEIKSGKLKWNPEDSQWYRRATSKTVAVPGASWHEGGYAIDFTGNVDLAGRVSKKYQLEQVTGTGETHHFQPLGVPNSKRMFLELKNNYGIDAIKTPLSPDLLLYINKEIASNVPRHPQRIKKVLDAAIAKFKTSLPGEDEQTVREKFLTFAGQSASPSKVDWSQVREITPTTVAKAIAPRVATTTTSTMPTTPSTLGGVGRIPGVDTTTTLAPRTTTTTLAPQTTTTIPSTTTTTPPEEVGGQRSLAPSQSEYGPRSSQPISTTTTMPVTTTTPKTTSTTMSPSTSTTNPPVTTTTLPSTQPTVPRPGQTTIPTTTVPTQNDVPSSIAPTLLNPATLSADGGQYALGVSGRRIYNSKGELVKYEGYKYTSPVTGKLAEPKYFTGDEDALYSLSVEELSNLQNAMYNVGKLGKGYAPGVVDSKTTSAYKSLLVTANGYGEDFETTITRLATTGASARGGQLNQYRVSNDADVKAIMNKVSQQTLGRKLGEGDLNRLSNLYRELERTSGQVETFTQNKLEEMFPEDTNARQFGSYLTALEKKYNL
jgi:hypothetical protein